MERLVQKVSSKGSTSRWVSGVEVFTIGGVEYTKGSPADVIAVTQGGVEIELKLAGKAQAVLCIRHKKYTANRKPRTNCEQCQRAYEQKRA